LAPDDTGASALTAERIIDGKTVILDQFFIDGRYLVLATELGLQRLWIRNCETGLPLAFAMPAGGDFAIRLATLRRFNETLCGFGGPADASRLIPSPFQSNRLRLLLRILDCLGDEPSRKAPVREVARRIVYPHSQFARTAEWKTSSERRRTQRLIQEAKFLAEHGYLALLQGQTEKRTCCN
jgi:Uncharacterized conserved protein (DUF2285)